MRVERFPVLTEADSHLVERLATGLDGRSARVLAYLALRERNDRFGDEPATLLSVRVGTGLGRTAAKETLSKLTEAGLVSETTVRTGEQGRPPAVWTVADGDATLCDRVYAAHAGRLVEQAAAVATDGGDDDATETSTLDQTGEERPDGRTDGHEATDRPEVTDRPAVTVSCNWRPNGLQLPLFAARASDAYADRGVDVRFVHRTGSRAALRDVRDGTAAVGLVGATTLCRARAGGAAVVPLALLYQRALVTLYTTRESFGEPFERAGQLRDRRVGTPVESEIGLLARVYLEQAGVADDVTVVDLPEEERAALLDGRVDAVTGSISDPERLREDDAAVDSTVDAIRVGERFPLYGPALVARRADLATRRSLLRAVLAGTVAGVGRARVDPRAGAAAIADESEESPKRVCRTFETARATGGESDAVERRGWGWHRGEHWERLRTVLSEVDLLTDR